MGSSSSFPLPLQLPAYQMGPEVGRGATSVVYRASHQGKNVAVKIVQPHVVRGGKNAEMALRFRREAAAMAQLNHPGLVKVLEVGQQGEQSYLIMELVEGETLTQRVERGALSNPVALQMARQLAGALAEVHRHGLVHRDITPNNIMVGAENAVKLMDFGFVTQSESDTSEREASDVVVGTFLYAAPEQTGMLNRHLDGRADLYGLGAVLFECATGKVPFRADTVGELLRMHASVLAPDARDLEPGVAPVFSAIIAKLLSKDPDDRYQTADGLLADLEAFEELSTVQRGGGTFVLGRRDFLRLSSAHVPLLGRESELQTLRGLWTAAAAGQGAGALVVGEPGCGKTRLVREVMQGAAEAGALVLSGKCMVVDNLPLAPLREAINGYLSQIQRLPESARAEHVTRLRRSAGEWGALVKRLSPLLAQMLGDVPELHALNASDEHERFYDAIATFFTGLAGASGRAVLLIDDVQWLDAASRAVLERLSRRLERSPLLVLATARSDPDSAAGLARFTALEEPRRSAKIELRPLDVPTSKALIRAHLGNKDVDAAILERLVALGNGNPFALGNYVRAVLEAGILVPVADRWHGEVEQLTHLQLPTDVIKLVVGRLRTLNPQTLQLLRVGALKGTEFSAEILARSTRMEERAVARALDEALAANLLETAGQSRVAFVHDRVREAVLSSIPPSEVQALHQAIAEALDDSSDPGDLFSLASHYAQGYPERNPRRAYECQMRAGKRALDSYADKEALAFLTGAAALAPAAQVDATERLTLLEALATACQRTGRVEDAYRHLEDALSLAADPVERARLQLSVANTRLSEGKNEEAFRDLQSAYRHLGVEPPGTHGLQYVKLMGTWMYALVLQLTGMRFGRAQGEVRRRRELLSAINAVGSNLAYFKGSAGLMTQLIVRELLNAHFLGVCRQTAVAYVYYALLMGLFALKGPAERYRNRALHMCEQIGDAAALALCRAVGAIATEASGDVLTSERMMREALPFVYRFLPAWEQACYTTELQYQLLYRGYAREAAESCEHELTRVDKLGSVLFQANSRGVLYSQLVLLGRVQEALAIRDEWLALAAKLPGVPFCQSYVHAHQLQALLELEDFGPALEGHIQGFQNINSGDYHTRYGHLLIASARLEQLRRAGPTEKPQARHLLRKAMFTAMIQSMTPVHKCQFLALRAGLASEEGSFRKSHQLLRKAELLAQKADSLWGLYLVYLERARLAKHQEQGVETRRWAQEALHLAAANGWRQRVRRVQSEFQVEQETRGGTLQLGTKTSATGSRIAAQQVEALLKVSVASAGSLDPVTQSRATLDVINQLFGAERAFLFRLQPDGSLALLLGRSAKGEDVPELKGYSSTVVRKVQESGQPLVVTGTEEGAVLESQSAVAHDLRSIMAAPAKLNGQLLGVVYLDSRVVKGLFTVDDLQILQALAAQLATSMELGRMATVEAQRLVLEKDLQLTGAVQEFFLLRVEDRRYGGVSLAARAQPATQCGGDWWWQEERGGKLYAVVGDVTGHGAAPAMLTAYVASAFRFFVPRDTDAAFDLHRLLELLSQELRELTRGGYLMTMTAVELDLRTGDLRLINAGGTAPVRMTAAGEAALVDCPPSSPLGAAPWHAAEYRTRLAPGDRLLLYTDGIPEMALPSGRDLRLKKLVALMKDGRGLTSPEAATGLLTALEQARGDVPLADDLTFLMLDMAA